MELIQPAVQDRAFIDVNLHPRMKASRTPLLLSILHLVVARVNNSRSARTSEVQHRYVGVSMVAFLKK